MSRHEAEQTPDYENEVQHYQWLALQGENVDQLGFKWNLPGFRLTDKQIEEMARIVVEFYREQKQIPTSDQTDQILP